ncbi:MAG: hypothetical protein Q9175_004001 [Cornicularia normoerica]
MATRKKLVPLRPIALLILLALDTTEALVLHGQPPSSLNTRQVIMRAEEAATLEPYTGNGAIPVATSWQLLSTDLPLQYKPTASYTTIRLTLKDNKASNINQPLIYNLTVLGLADVASLAVTTNGNKGFPRSGQENSTFATSYLPSNLQFVMTTSHHLPVYAVVDVLRGIQELTHYLFFLELVFEVFSDINPISSPIATGCLAFHCGSHIETMQTRGLEYVNSSAGNVSSPPSRQLQSSIAPIQLTTFDEIETVAVTYHDLKNPLPIYDQNFADIATRMLADITNRMIADPGDGLLPFFGTSKRRFLRYVDTWGSKLAISLFPMNLLGTNFTLSQAAMALKTTQYNMSNGPMVESKLEIMVDGSMVGWGCLSYANASAWRCLMPTPR